MRLILCLLILVTVSKGAEWLPDSDRLPGGILWQRSNLGIPGGIPNTSSMTVYTTLPSSSTAAQINTAITACPSGQVVALGAGTFTLDAYLVMKSNMALKGASTSSTILNFTSSVTGSQCIFMSGDADYNPPAGKIKDWTAGYAQGATSITVSDATDISVGQLLVLDQTNDTSIGVSSDSADLGHGADRPQCQVVRVTGKASNVLTISPGLHMANWSSGLSPKVWWWTSSIENVGIEDLTITRNLDCDVQYNVVIQYADKVWFKNIESSYGKTANLFFFWSKNCEVRHSYFHHSLNAGVTAYGIEMNASCDALIEDNIFYHIAPGVLLRGGSEGCVFAYNYHENAFNDLPSWLGIGISSNHRAHPCMNLFEGNVTTSWYADFIHGSSSHLSTIRNRFVGHETGKDTNTLPIVMEAHNRYMTFAGNVLGKVGYHNQYDYNDETTPNWAAIWRYGHAGTSSDETDYDTSVGSTLVRKANYNTFTGGIPAGESLGSDTLGSSWYLSSRPVWFGTLDWPVNFGTGSYSEEAPKIPAGYRYLNGVDPKVETQNISATSLNVDVLTISP